MPQVDIWEIFPDIFNSMNTLPDFDGDVTVTGGLLDLCHTCPAERGNPKNCKFYNIRKMTPEEQLLWVRGLNKKTGIRMIRQHQECMARRQEKHQENHRGLESDFLNIP